MAATTEWDETNGAFPGGVTHGITGINTGSTDAPNLDPATYQITRPGWSHDKWWKFHFTGGIFTKVDNFKVWRSDNAGGDGPASIATGIELEGEAGAGIDLTYTDPVNTDKGLSAMPYLEASALDVGPGAGFTGIGYSYYIHCQLRILATAAEGDTPTYNLTFRWDEK